MKTVAERVAELVAAEPELTAEQVQHLASAVTRARRETTAPVPVEPRRRAA